MFSLLLLTLLSAHADEGAVRKVAAWVQAGKLDKATEFCNRGAAKGTLDPRARETCSGVTLDSLIAKGEPDLSALDAHWRGWSGTGGATRSRALAAEQRLEAAVRALNQLDYAALRTLARDWADTPAGAGALEVLWRDALATGTAKGISAFMAEFPDAPQAAVAQATLLERALAEARADGTLAGWEQFLANYPDHPQAHVAGEWIATLRFQAAESANTVAAWEEFLRMNPRHRRVDEAERALVAARFAVATDPHEILALVAQYPEFPRAKLVWAEATLALAEIRAVGNFGEVLLAPEGSSGGAIATLHVRWPVTDAAIAVSVLGEVQGRVVPLADALATVPGWTRAVASKRSHFEPHPIAGMGVDLQFSVPLCQPPGSNWLLHLRLGAAERLVRFTTATPCT